MRIKKTLLSQKPKPGAINWALGLLFLFTIVSVCYWQRGDFAKFLTASREQVFSQNEYWRLFTALSVHADIAHLGSNSVLFLIFGYLLYNYFGAFIFPLSSVILGGLLNSVVLFLYPARSTLIGASGMIYLMAGFWISLYCFIERSQPVKMRILRSLGFILILLVPQEFQPHVSYLAHGLGFIIGTLFGAIYFFFERDSIRRAEVIEVDDEDHSDFTNSSESSVCI